MATKIYVAEPKFVLPLGTDDVVLCFQVLEWPQGQFPNLYPPCNPGTGSVSVAWGEGVVEVRQKAIDMLLEAFPDATSNDIIFLGGWQ
jgi:hypothetical protein